MVKSLVMAKQIRKSFLEALAGTGNVSEAVRVAKISRSTVYKYRKIEVDFAREWDEAEQEAADRLEREAWRRAVEGFDKPVIYRGKVTDIYKDYSDRMLELLLKAKRPGKFKKPIDSEETGKERGPQTGLEKTAASERLIAILDKMSLRPDDGS
ncbi:MAG: hypothetical protein PSN37_04775 [Alphaproteobacteria bacterium]|nr:hypothetical protein [Alphaproteobacteria bacterium]